MIQLARYYRPLLAVFCSLTFASAASAVVTVDSDDTISDSETGLTWFRHGTNGVLQNKPLFANKTLQDQQALYPNDASWRMATWAELSTILPSVFGGLFTRSQVGTQHTYTGGRFQPSGNVTHNAYYYRQPDNQQFSLVFSDTAADPRIGVWLVTGTFTQPIPEPATLALMLAGLAVVGRKALAGRDHSSRAAAA